MYPSPSSSSSWWWSSDSSNSTGWPIYSSQYEGDLGPTAEFLKYIFGDLPIELRQILSHSPYSCVFKVYFHTSPHPLYGNLLVRLQKGSSRMATVVALQNLAHSVLPDLVPKVLETTTFKTSDGEEYEYSIEEFVDGTRNLWAAWRELDTAQQREMMDSIGTALAKLQTLKLDDSKVREALKDTPFTKEACPFGSAVFGYFKDVPELLRTFITNFQPYDTELSTVINDCLAESGVTVKSIYSGIPSVNISRENLDALKKDSVLCHHDLEPRNILVRQSPNGGYELAAIVDWETAGFYPFAFEYWLKDWRFGRDDQNFTWYMNFKERLEHLLPQHEGTDKFIAALQTIDEGRERKLGRLLDGVEKKLWIVRNGGVWVGGRKGWGRKEGKLR